MIKKILLALILILMSYSLGLASDFMMFRDGKGNWVIRFLDPDNPSKCHTICIKLDGHVWKKEALAYDKTEFNTHKNTTEAPVVRIEEYE